MRISLLLLSPLMASAFMITTNSYAPNRLSMSKESTEDINLVLNGRNIELTEAISGYVEKRLGGPLRKLASGGVVRECDVHLFVNQNPKVRSLLLSIRIRHLTYSCQKVTDDSSHRSTRCVNDALELFGSAQNCIVFAAICICFILSFHSVSTLILSVAFHLLTTLSMTLGERLSPSRFDGQLEGSHHPLHGREP
jgi:hypothetical protein